MSADERTLEGLARSDVRQTSNYQLSEAIQNLPPELREIIYKGYVAIKLRERAALGWTKVHEHILKLPFCHFMQQIVPTVVDSYPYNPFYEGCCYPCLNKDGRGWLIK